jgi:hypothetical protein
VKFAGNTGSNYCRNFSVAIEQSPCSNLGIPVSDCFGRAGLHAAATTNTPAMYNIRKFLVWFNHNGFYWTNPDADVAGFANIMIYIYKR